MGSAKRFFERSGLYGWNEAVRHALVASFAFSALRLVSLTVIDPINASFASLAAVSYACFLWEVAGNHCLSDFFFGFGGAIVTAAALEVAGDWGYGAVPLALVVAEAVIRAVKGSENA